MKYFCAALIVVVLTSFIIQDKNSNVASPPLRLMPAASSNSISLQEEFLTGKTWQVMEVNDLSH